MKSTEIVQSWGTELQEIRATLTFYKHVLMRK